MLPEAYGSETLKSQVFLGGINSSKKARTSKSQMKTIPITFLHIKRIVHFGFIPQGQTVNQAYVVETMKQLHEAARRRGPDFGPTIGFATMTMFHVISRPVK
jgi:hypothetical protein